MGAFTSESVIQHAPSCWFPLSHADAVVGHPHLRLVALSDTNPATLMRAAGKFGVGKCFEDPRDLLRSEKLDLLCVATRTVGRADLIRATVEAGIRAVHAEKPLCNSVAELQDLERLFASGDVFVTWGALRRYFGVYRQALAIAQSGIYGELREVRVNFGSASLFWTHPHSIDLLLFAASGRQVSGVQARLADVVACDGERTRIETDPRVLSASVYFDDGLAGHVTQALGSDFVLSCEHAEIAVRADGATMELYSTGSGVYPAVTPLEVDAAATPGGTLAPVSQLVACLEGDAASIRANAVVKRDILQAQWLAFAMVQSHLEGSRVVEPSAVDPAMVIHAVRGGQHA